MSEILGTDLDAIEALGYDEVNSNDVCGEAYDHFEETTYENDTVSKWRCLECGVKGYREKY